MSRVYVDLGAHVGKTTEAWLLGHPDDRVYAWEPNPACLANPRWLQLMAHFADRLELIAAAAWIEDTVLPLFRSSTNPGNQSATLLLGKRTGDVSYGPGCAVEVEARDFSSWLRGIVRPGDLLTIKMDIEGSEYQVLTRLIEEGTIHLVDRLLIEWHVGKFTDQALKVRHAAVLRGLARAGTLVEAAEH